MRTLYYNIVIKRQNFENAIEEQGFESSFSEGFAIINFKGDKIDKIEGVLTMDYLIGEVRENQLRLSYFIPDVDFRGLKLDTTIIFKLEDLKVFQYKILIIDNNGNVTGKIEIIAETEVINENLKRSYDMRLQEFKKLINFRGAS